MMASSYVKKLLMQLVNAMDIASAPLLILVTQRFASWTASWARKMILVTVA
jgi:hypothetical protein